MEVYWQSKLELILVSALKLTHAFHRHEEGWHKIRSIVNPIMMQPNTIKLYIPQVEAIVDDFIKM